jgi:hypothetical protein
MRWRGIAEPGRQRGRRAGLAERGQEPALDRLDRDGRRRRVIDDVQIQHFRLFHH